MKHIFTITAILLFSSTSPSFANNKANCLAAGGDENFCSEASKIFRSNGGNWEAAKKAAEIKIKATINNNRKENCIAAGGRIDFCSKAAKIFTTNGGDWEAAKAAARQ